MPLKKTYAGKSRTFLKLLIKKEGISEADILKELAALRKKTAGWQLNLDGIEINPVFQ